MSPTTRAVRRETIPPSQIKAREHGIVEKTRFYNAYNTRSRTKSLHSISKAIGMPKSLARRLLR